MGAVPLNSPVGPNTSAREEGHGVSGTKRELGPPAKESRQPVKAEKGQEMDFLREPLAPLML